ncbi:MAG: hypothetical protein IMZ52_04420 [Actinobacteria bacterium]|nr:hypothetical protein [Actinomycetota bacterium]MBE3122036.1 hypothetical protein [Thermoplasmata archaeon]
MKKEIIVIILISILSIVLFSGCINKESQEEYINDWEKNSEKMRQLGTETAFTEINSWCSFRCHFEKGKISGSYWLDVESGGAGNVTVSFKFNDKNATICGEDYMKPYAIGNSTWKIYTNEGSGFRWILHIFSNSSENITLTVTKDLEPFSSCPDCKFQSIIKELNFKIQDEVRGFL